MSNRAIIYKSDLIKEIENALKWRRHILIYMIIHGRGRWAEVFTQNSNIEHKLSMYDSEMSLKADKQCYLKEYEIRGM